MLYEIDYYLWLIINVTNKLLFLPLCSKLMAFNTMLAILLLLFIAITCLLHLLTRGKRDDRVPTLVLPPGPKKLPVIGNLHQLGALLHRSLWLLSQKHGPLMLLQLGSIPTLVVSSAETAKEILKTNDLSFCSRPRLFAPTKYTYGCRDISFAPYGAYWREMRKVCILELFSLKRVEQFRFVREEEVSSMIGAIAARSPSVVDLSETAVGLASRIICRVAMGNKYEKSGLHGILVEMQVMLGSFFFVDFFPSMGWVDRLTGLTGRLERSAGELDALYEQVIEEHLDPMRNTRLHGEEDVVDVLLRLQQEGMDLTRDHIKAVLTDIFIAGTETTTATLVWAMAELIRNPRLMKKAQDEVRAIAGSKAKIDEDDLHNLPFLKSIVKETLRLRGPVPLLIPHEATRQCKISGYDVAANTRVFINAWAIGRDPKTWEDPEEFIPERFMGSQRDFRGQNFEFIPFGSGRRICPAMNLGLATIELTLASLLFSFEWELPLGIGRADLNMNEAPGLTIHMRRALQLVATSYDRH